jgi:hypothetical protein
VTIELEPLRVNVPLLMFRSALNVAAPAMVNGPAVKETGAPEIKLLMA